MMSDNLKNEGQSKCPKCNEVNDLAAEYCWKCYFDFVPNNNSSRFVKKENIVASSESGSSSVVSQKFGGVLLWISFILVYFQGMRLALDYMRSKNYDSFSTAIFMVIGNVPNFVALGRILFGSLESFGEAFRFYITPNIISLMFGEWSRDVWQSIKFCLWLTTCFTLIWFEYGLY